MTDTTLMALGQGMQQLKGYPMLHFSTCVDEAYILLACVWLAVIAIWDDRPDVSSRRNNAGL